MLQPHNLLVTLHLCSIVYSSCHAAIGRMLLKRNKCTKVPQVLEVIKRDWIGWDFSPGAWESEGLAY